jgi:hypothetical protein
VAGFVLIMSPWLIRNIVTETKVIRPTLSINFLHHGMYPDFKFAQRDETYGFPYAFDPRAAAINRDMPSILSEIGRRFLQEPLRHMQWYLLNKPLTFWSWGLIQGQDVFVYAVSTSPYGHHAIFRATHLFMRFFHGGLVFAALLAGIAVWLPQASRCLPRFALLSARFAALLLIYFTLLHMVGAPFPRYAVPLRPYLYAMAMLGVYLAYQTIKKQVRASRPQSVERKKKLAVY